MMKQTSETHNLLLFTQHDGKKVLLLFSVTMAAKATPRSTVKEKHVKCNEEKCKLRYIVCFPIRKIETEIYPGEKKFLHFKFFHFRLARLKACEKQSEK